MFLKIILLLMVAGGLIWAIKNLESRAVYFPSRVLEIDPPATTPPFENVFFRTADHFKLNGWFIPAQGGADTVLFCHGNAGNISHRLEKIAFFHQLGLNVFIFDYRGYGHSEGSPSERGLFRDVDAAYGYLISQGISPDHILGYGESLGGAVIIDLASRKPMKALIVEGTFTSLREMAATHYSFIPSWIITSRFDSKQKIASINIPKLIIHSLNDEIVPFALGEDLFKSAAQPKEFLKISGDHNEGFFQSEALIRQKITDWLASLKK